MLENKTNFEKDGELLNDKSKKIIVFGTTALAMMGMRVVEQLGRKIYCFCDNNLSKQGSNIAGVRVEPPQIIKTFSEEQILIIVCAYREKAYEEITMQIKEMGNYRIFDRLFVEYMYQTKILNRNMDNAAFEKALCSQRKDGTFYIEKAISIGITNKCSLNCKHCVSYIPFQKEKADRSTDEILNGLRTLSENVDFIHAVSLVGGEALLHEKIIYLCREIAKISNLGMIRLITNGNTYPKPEVFEQLSKYITEINLSDYGKYSKYKSDVKHLCEKFRIIYNEKSFSNDNWIDLGGFQKRDYNIGQLKKMLKSCPFTDNCLSLKRGRIYFCGRTAWMNELAGIEEYDEDYVELYGEKAKERLKSFLSDTDYLQTCKHCGLLENKEVKAGVQAMRILDLEEEYGKC